MKPLTLQEAKDKIAERHGFENCDDMKKRWGNVPERISDEAAQLYGDSQYNQAIEKAIKISENRQDESTDNAEYLGHLKVIEELKRLKR